MLESPENIPCPHPLPTLHPWSREKWSSTKPVPGARKAEDHCPRGLIQSPDCRHPPQAHPPTSAPQTGTPPVSRTSVTTQLTRTPTVSSPKPAALHLHLRQLGSTLTVTTKQCRCLTRSTIAHTAALRWVTRTPCPLFAVAPVPLSRFSPRHSGLPPVLWPRQCHSIAPISHQLIFLRPSSACQAPS